MKSKAIVLTTLRYGDEQLIVDLLTEARGCVTMMVRISRSRRAQVRHTLFQPLALLDVEWNDRPTAQFQRPKAVQSAYAFTSLPYNPYKSAIALFLAEFLHYAVRTESDARGVFAFVEKSIEWLDESEHDFSNFHIVFLLRLTRFLGFMPSVEEFAAGTWFDMRSCTFTATKPMHADVLEPHDAALVPLILRMRYGNMRVFRFNGAERTRLLELINTFYRLHLPSFPELKSLAVLKQIF